MFANPSAGFARRFIKPRARVSDNRPLVPSSRWDPSRPLQPCFENPDPAEARENYRVLLLFMVFGASVFGACYLISYEDFQRKAARQAHTQALFQVPRPVMVPSLKQARTSTDSVLIHSPRPKGSVD